MHSKYSRTFKLSTNSSRNRNYLKIYHEMASHLTFTTNKILEKLS